MRTYVYVDGFNLYYGALKGTPYKWLNLYQLCQLLLPRNQVLKIKYFTARVAPRAPDPGQAVRQQMYLRALQTLPCIEIIEGSFLSTKCRMYLANSAPGHPQFVEVIKTEEKGSDVNMAAHLISDGYKGAYEVAALITNDSDLTEAVRIVRQELSLPVGIINPHKHASNTLAQHASFRKNIRTGVLKVSQFADSLCDSTGRFTKPREWP